MADNKHSKHSDDDAAPQHNEVEDLHINDSTKELAETPEETPHKEPEESSGEELQHAMESATVQPEAGDASMHEPKEKSKSKSKFSTKKKVIFGGLATVIIAIAVLFAVPLTRYAIAGVVVKKDISFSLVDSKTGKPVSGVQVSVAGMSASSDAKGNATIKHVPVGQKSVLVKKHYYQDLTSSVLVPIFGSKNPYQLSVIATGRQAPVQVTNKITGQPIEKATITFDGASSTTDNQGNAIVVLPADKATVTATISANGYNQASVTVLVTEQQDPKNTFTVVPSGKVYFLSKLSGTIDVVKSDLDGSNRQTVLAGTGNESDSGTVLLASRDWKYLALQSRRDGNNDKLYLIDTTQGDKLTTIDEGDASFKSVGWYNQYFMYTTSRNQVQDWQPKKNALKSFNAQTGQLTIIDESNAAGDQNAYSQENFSQPYILNNLLVYIKAWEGYGSVSSGKQAGIYAIQPSGQQKQTLQTVASSVNVQARLYEPQGLYFREIDYSVNNAKSTYYKYEDGQFAQSNISDADYSKFYPTYLLSPSGNSTFWYEPRDGKSTLFVGDANGSNAKEIASLSDYTPYGWFSDDYLFVSKNGSELYVLSRNNPNSAPVKVTDYHKSAATFYGYGYGYGGGF